MNTRAEQPALLTRRDRTMLAITVVATAAAGVLYFAGVNAVVAFVVAALALATLASLVGRSVEALGDRLGPNATGILQTALGNLPELFVIMFALKAGLFGVVKATIVGSILSNALLVLGLAFVVGGLKHGRQRFAADDVRTLGLMFTLAVFILAIPSLTDALHTPQSRTSGRCRWSSPSSCWCCSHSRCRPRWESGTRIRWNTPERRLPLWPARIRPRPPVLPRHTGSGRW